MAGARVKNMSLVYAKRISASEMYFIADTKFTFSTTNVNKAVRHSKTEEYIGGLKLVVLHGGLIVAFAGNVHFAEKAIKGIYSKNIDLWDIQDVSEYLSAIAVESENSTDFLVGHYGENEVGLTKIVGDRISEEQVSWIGDSDGFNLFQENMLNQTELEIESNHSQMMIISNPDEENTTKNVFSEIIKAHKAFLNVINNDSCTSVSGVISIACTSKIGFRYSEYLLLTGPAVAATSGNGGIYFGDEKSGSFCISSGRAVNCPVYPVLYNIGGFGIIYSPTKSFQPTRIKLSSELDFNEIYSSEVQNIANEIDSLPG